MIRTFLNSLVLVLCALAGGCQWSPTFRLEDLDRLDPGRNTREDLERILGPSESAVRPVFSSSERDVVIPPAPLSFLLFPLFFHAHDRSFRFTAELTSEGVLSTGSLEIFEQTRTRVLLLFGANDFRVTLKETELELLNNLRKKGIDVKVVVNPVLCFGGVIGWHSIPLDDYLREQPQD